MKSPIILLGNLLVDTKRFLPDVKGLDRDFITIWSRFYNEGYGFLTISLPTICAALDRGLSDGLFACPTGFSKIKSGAIPKFLSGLLCNIFEPRTGILKDDPCIESIKSIRELTYLFKKTQLDSSREELLHDKAVAKFWSTDETCGGSYDAIHVHLVTSVCNYLLINLDSRRLDGVDYRHGPGAVAENIKGNQKWVLLDSELVHFDSALTGHDVHIRKEWKSLEYESMFETSNVPPSDCARLVTVSKNSTSRRTITVEPMRKQFVQQGLNTVLRQEIDIDPVLNLCLALNDQGPNQKLALDGSITGEWSTIDLSSASDRLDYELVKIVFGRHPRFLEALGDCRSPSCNDGITVRSMKKFAGMGNALTFPVQSIVFAAICIAAIHSKEGLRPTYRSVKRVASTIRVYGDDIIVRTDCVRQVVDWIESFGLKVNTDKSFWSGNFRESCGVDAYKGVDVTPTYLRSRPDGSTKEPGVMLSLVSASNQLWKKALYGAASYLRWCVEESLGEKLPFVHSESGALGWHSRQEFSEIHRWNRKLQRFEVRAFAPSSVFMTDTLSGYPALLKFFHTSLLERREGHLSKSPRRYRIKLVRKNIPTHVGNSSWLPYEWQRVDGRGAEMRPKSRGF